MCEQPTDTRRRGPRLHYLRVVHIPCRIGSARRRCGASYGARANQSLPYASLCPGQTGPGTAPMARRHPAGNRLEVGLPRFHQAGTLDQLFGNRVTPGHFPAGDLLGWLGGLHPQTPYRSGRNRHICVATGRHPILARRDRPSIPLRARAAAPRTRLLDKDVEQSQTEHPARTKEGTATSDRRRRPGLPDPCATHQPIHGTT